MGKHHRKRLLQRVVKDRVAGCVYKVCQNNRVFLGQLQECGTAPNSRYVESNCNEQNSHAQNDPSPPDGSSFHFEHTLGLLIRRSQRLRLFIFSKRFHRGHKTIAMSRDGHNVTLITSGLAQRLTHHEDRLRQV